MPRATTANTSAVARGPSEEPRRQASMAVRRRGASGRPSRALTNGAKGPSRAAAGSGCGRFWRAAAAETAAGSGRRTRTAGRLNIRSASSYGSAGRVEARLKKMLTAAIAASSFTAASLHPSSRSGAASAAVTIGVERATRRANCSAARSPASISAPSRSSSMRRMRASGKPRMPSTPRVMLKQ